MSNNTKRTITVIVFAGGIILGILGWAHLAYSSTVGTVIFLCCLVVAITLKILWKKS